MTDDETTPDREAAAIARMAEMDQMAASLRGVAEAIVLIRRTLVEGGFPDETANVMATRAWMHFFPGQPPQGFGFLLGGPPS